MARRVVNRLVFEDRDDLDGVRGLSKATAAALREGGRTTRLEVVDRRRSAIDPFVKYLFRAPDDGQVFETVRIPLEQPRCSVCVSSQVGCALACAFCETGRLGLHAQPRAVGDGGAGAHRAARVAGAARHRCGVPGPGRALPELRQRHPRGGAPAPPLRRAHPRRPHHDLHRGSRPPDRALHGRGPPLSADPLPHLGLLREARPPRARSRSATACPSWPGPCAATRRATADR